MGCLDVFAGEPLNFSFLTCFLYVSEVETIPTPSAIDDQQDSPLVQTIIEEKEQLLTEKKSGNNAVFSDLRKKLIENLKKLAPDLSLSFGNNNTNTSKGNIEEKAKENVAGKVENQSQTVTEVRGDNGVRGSRRKMGVKQNLKDIQEQLKDPEGNPF